MAGAVEEPPLNDPPSIPADGACYLVGGAPTGAWHEHPNSLAGYDGAGWRFIPPSPGMRAFVKSTGTYAVYLDERWEIGTVRASHIEIGGLQVVGPRTGAVADPAGGVTADAEARVAISEILAALRQHGLISE